MLDPLTGDDDTNLQRERPNNHHSLIGFALMPPNVPDQRPGATETRYETRASSPGSLHLVCWEERLSYSVAYGYGSLLILQTKNATMETAKQIMPKVSSRGYGKRCVNGMESVSG